MSELHLPGELKGMWEHAVFVTYGADLPFFERVLSRQLPVSCRNRVVLADQRQFLEACIHFAEGGLVRTLNQHYAADGVRSSHAMHAKLILLCARERGRLLVGSGNLGLQGYASGGELFTRYEYDPNRLEDISAFVATRAFIERLIAEERLGAVATTRLQHLLESIPWLFQQTAADSPVRHNIDASFLSQVVEAVNGEPVDELTVMAPFYDADAIALGELASQLAPTKLRVLVQPSRTSVDPSALERIRGGHAGIFELLPVARPDDVYIHAKLLLVKLRDRAISLQGSPNLSQVALLRHGPDANIELANLLTGPRDAFDELLAGLDVGQPATSADSLDVQLEQHDLDSPPSLTGWHLTRAEFSPSELSLHFAGTLPSLENPRLWVGDRSFPIANLGNTGDTLVVRLTSEALEQLEATQPVSIEWFDKESEVRSNPVFACNLLALERVLESTGSERLQWIGSFDGLDDDELEHLLQELADSLVIDQESLWRISGRAPPQAAEGEEAWIAYEDVDYEALREHPKLRQYRFGHTAGAEGASSRLQIILASIAASFGPRIAAVHHPSQAALADIDATDAETEEELEQDAERLAARLRTLEAHLGRIFQNFIRRYLKGATTQEFEHRVGPEVITQNYLIFSFILWRLFRKPWMAPRFLVESLIETWGYFFAIGETEGFLARLPPERRDQTISWLREQRAGGLLIASIYYSAHLTRVEELDDVRLSLRDTWRNILLAPPFGLDAGLAAEAVEMLSGLFAGAAPERTRFQRELVDLADFETAHTFTHSIPGIESAWFAQELVMRPSLNRRESVKCLFVLPGSAHFSPPAMLDLLSQWMRFERRDYYRVKIEGSSAMCFFDVAARQGKCWAGKGSELRDLTSLPEAVRPWDAPLVTLLGREARLPVGSTLAGSGA